MAAFDHAKISHDRFGFKDYAISILVIFGWLFLSYSSLALDYKYMFIPMYLLTVYLSYMLKKKLPKIIIIFGLLTSLLAMFIVRVYCEAYLPFPHLSSSVPLFIKFIYFLYPPILGGLITTLVFFYPLQRLFQDNSRLCVWGLTIFLLCFSGHFFFDNNIRLPLMRLVGLLDTFSTIIIWFIVVQITKTIKRLKSKTLTEIQPVTTLRLN